MLTDVGNQVPPSLLSHTNSSPIYGAHQHIIYLFPVLQLQISYLSMPPNSPLIVGLIKHTLLQGLIYHQGKLLILAGPQCFYLILQLYNTPSDEVSSFAVFSPFRRK